MGFSCACLLYAAAIVPVVGAAATSSSAASLPRARAAQVTPKSTAPPQPSPEDEVLANLRAQKIGSATLADLGLPEDYLRRVAGRILRASFEESFRVVVADEKSAAEGREGAPGASTNEAHAQPASANEARAQGASRGDARAPGASTQSEAREHPEPRAGPGPDSTRGAEYPHPASISAAPTFWMLAAAIAVLVASIVVGVRIVLRRGARGR